MIDMTLEELIGAVRLEPEILIGPMPGPDPKPIIMDGDEAKKAAEERKDPSADPSKSRA